MEKKEHLCTAGRDANWYSQFLPYCGKTVWKILRKLKIELPYDLVIALLDIYPKNTKTLMQRDTCTPMFITALLITAKLWNQPSIH